MYQHSCHNTSEAYGKLAKSKEKLDSIKGPAARRKKAEEKFREVIEVASAISLGCSLQGQGLGLGQPMQPSPDFLLECIKS